MSQQLKTLHIHMDDTDLACRVITAFEVLQNLRMLLQHQINADIDGISDQQILSHLQVVELAMRHAIEQM